MIAELYTVYRTELLKYCCMICGNISDAENLLQETFIKALSNLNLLEELVRKNEEPGYIRWQEICSMMPVDVEHWKIDIGYGVRKKLMVDFQKLKLPLSFPLCHLICPGYLPSDTLRVTHQMNSQKNMDFHHRECGRP